MQRAVAMTVFQQHGWTFKRTEDKMLMTDEDIARVAYEGARAAKQAQFGSRYPSWEEAPPGLRADARAVVEFMRKHPEVEPRRSDLHAVSTQVFRAVARALLAA